MFLLLFLLRPVSASNAYWFQVGVFPDIGPVSVTGASVEIRTHVLLSPKADTSFWVGLSFPNDAFIQVGYVSWLSTGGYPQRFWEYYPPKTASAGGGVFHGDFEGDEVGPNGTWYTYSMYSQGTTWSFYINGVLDGSYAVGLSSGNSNWLSAVAEVSAATTTHNALGPAEFRDFRYRDANNQWHNVTSALAYVGLGSGSGTLPPSIVNPYGLQVLSNNDWLAGSGLPQAQNNQLLWSEGATSVTTSLTYQTSTSTYPPYTQSKTQSQTTSQNMGLEVFPRIFSSNFIILMAISVAGALLIGAVIYYWPTKSRKGEIQQTKLDTILTEQPVQPHLQPTVWPGTQKSIPTPAKSSPDMMFCNQCGSRISRDSEFCKECGARQT